MQHTFTLHRLAVRVSATHGGKQYRKATGLSVADASLWDSTAKSLRAKCKDSRILPDLLAIHARLTDKERYASSEEDVLSAINYAITGRDTPSPSSSFGSPSSASKIPSFWEYFDEWGERPSTSKRQRKLAVKTIARLMGRNENWDDIDTAYWFRLQRRMEDEGFGVNYRWNIGTRLKTAMHEGYKLKYHKNQDFREFQSKKEQTEAIALTKEEIELLWEYKPRNEMYGKVRDLALIGYYSASRFSDYSRLSMDNIRDGRLEFVQQKTGDKVLIPASPRLVLLLERNGGSAPKVNQVVFNRYIKTIAKDSGISGFVSVRGKLIERYKMVQSHSFRRSSLTELYLSGVPVKDCMFVSGHRSISAFERYLKIGREQAASRLSENSFFK